MKYTVLACAAALLLTGGYHRLKAARSREPIDRRHEGWLLLIGIRLAALATAVAVYLSYRAAEPVALAAQAAGTAVFAVSSAWLIWMFLSLGANLTDTVITRREAKFVCHGPYRYVRNPMYIGILFLGSGLALYHGSWAVFIGALTCFVLLAIRTRIEERFLINRFGTVYESYMGEVGRFVPYIL
jgi:protein-S-isoprenylcysteine O-methyltransferase Ste14